MAAVYPDPNTDYLTPNFVTPSGLSAAQMQQHEDLLRAQKAESDFVSALVFIGLAFAAVGVGTALYRRRQRIIEVADNVLIDGSVAAVKGARAARRGWGTFKDRVIAKADQVNDRKGGKLGDWSAEISTTHVAGNPAGSTLRRRDTFTNLPKWYRERKNTNHEEATADPAAEIAGRREQAITAMAARYRARKNMTDQRDD